jgi:hypothetical protein
MPFGQGSQGVRVQPRRPDHPVCVVEAGPGEAEPEQKPAGVGPQESWGGGRINAYILLNRMTTSLKSIRPFVLKSNAPTGPLSAIQSI